MNINWKDTLEESGESVDDQWDKFKCIIKEAELKHIPNKIFNNSVKKRSIPADPVLIEARKKKNRTWTRYIETRDPDKYKEYTRQRNKVKSLSRKAHKKIETNICNNAKHNPKLFWGYVKNRTKSFPKVSDLVKSPDGDTEELTENDKEKAEVLASFFCSVYTREPINETPILESRKYKDSITNIHVTENQIEKALSKLKVDKAPGPDEIHPQILKELRKEIAPALKIIYNNVLSKAHLPIDWKHAHITPVFKKGVRKFACNYRPVSLTCISCKLLETLIREKIIDHMKTNSLFSKKQYGFISGRSTVLQLLKTLDDWTETIDRGEELDTIYLDFLKAFDTVPHKRLINKLKAYGIKGNILNWIHSFITNRKQKVVVNGQASEWAPVISGIPQGSVLGPVLFIIFINDLPDNISSNLLIFADDTKIYRQIKHDNDQNILQEDIYKLQEWSDKWLLKINPDKCT